MPYPRAYLYVLGLIGFAVWAFWPSYFSVLGEAPTAFHVHGITATLWMGLVAWQAWSIHNRHARLHRLTGKLSFLLIPAFIAGGMMVIESFQMRPGDPFAAAYGIRLSAIDVLALAAFAWLTAGALRHRADVDLHARYMLATPLLLLGPIFARLCSRYVPGLTITGVEEFPRFVYSTHITQALTVIVALILYSRSRPAGRPFLIVAAVAALQSVAFEAAAGVEAWRGLLQAYAGLPTAAIIAAGLLIGAVAVWFGWTRPAATSPATAA
ncbi:hypothetical protein DDZ18_12465 [Marinicauda salina]|uniref:Uncharacterized protein n=1 Tax=Marinicauda salina TaxID=2135793 RepID=A0A2U2BRF7_9PROT|nr:hypothetical protein [Marinicauda salina]PWE16576.1 hypothetical protein DDZ18_12465 [Marinicauda salina]